MLCESIRQSTVVSSSCVWSAKMALQTIVFFLCKSKHEIFRKTLDISFYLPIHLFHFYLINCCKISVYKYLFTPDRNDKFLNIMLAKSWLVLLKVVAICDYLFWLITIDDMSLYFFLWIHGMTFIILVLRLQRQKYKKIPSFKQEWEYLLFIYAFLWLDNPCMKAAQHVLRSQ